MFNKESVFNRGRGTGQDRLAGQARTEVETPLQVQQRARQTESARSPSPDTATVHNDSSGKEEKSQEQGSRLIVGPNIKLKGAEITDCDTLVVEGRVEASMQSRVMQIAQSGVFAGTAGIDVAEIHGRFEGELTVRKRLVIHSSGRVSGKIRYGTVSIAEGGEISGDVGSLERSESRTPATPLLDSVAPAAAADPALQAPAAALRR
jgi:cytoskeletal protein CcmA (bactofilin family)